MLLRNKQKGEQKSRVIVKTAGFDTANEDFQGIIRPRRESGNVMGFLKLCGNVGTEKHTAEFAALKPMLSKMCQQNVSIAADLVTKKKKKPYINRPYHKWMLIINKLMS